MQKWKLQSNRAVVVVNTSVCVIDLEFLQPPQFCSNCTIRCEDDIILKEIVRRRLSAMMNENGQPMARGSFSPDLFFPLSNEGQRPND